MTRYSDNSKVSLTAGNWIALVLTILLPTGGVLIQVHNYASDTKTRIAVLEVNLANQGLTINELKTKVDQLSRELTQ